MAFLGFRAWGTPVRPSLLRPQPTLRLTHFALHQIMKPLWPFLAAGTLTFYLVSKAQDMGVRGASASSSSAATRPLTMLFPASSRGLQERSPQPVPRTNRKGGGCCASLECSAC